MLRTAAVGLALLSLLSGIVHGAPRAAKNVQVSVEAPWGAAPLVLEASEFFSGDHFWRFAASIPANGLAMSDKDQYDAVLSAAGALVSKPQVDILKYALALRNFSPRLQAYTQLWAHAEASGCSLAGSAVAVVEGKCVTDPSALKDTVATCAAAKSGEASGADGVLDFEHVFTGTGGSKPGAVTVLLYAAIGTPTFLSFHAELTQLASAGEVKYVLRHAWPLGAAKSMPIQGYGVELAIKNMEYKAVDDRKREGVGDEDDAEADQEDAIDGFDFKVLMGRRPELKEDLSSFRETLREDVDKSNSAEIKVWALKDLGIQASQRVMLAEEPLRLIRDLSHNLPSMVSSVSRMRVNPQIRTEIEGNRQFMHPGTNMVLLNGRRLDAEAMSPFGLLDIVRHETALMEEIGALGLDGASSRKLINAPTDPEGMQSGEGKVFRIDIKEDAHINWLNDLEKDATYARWPKELNTLLQRGWPGQMRNIARNLYTGILIVEPSDPECLGLLAEMFSMLQQQMPFRAGVIFISRTPLPPAADSEDKKDDKKDDEGEDGGSDIPIGLRVFRLFNALHAKHGKDAAFTFLASYADAVQRDPTERGQLDLCKATFKGIAKQFPAVGKNAKGKPDKARWNPASEDRSNDAKLVNSTAFIRAAGLPLDEPVVVLNGEVMQGQMADMNQFMHKMSVQQQDLQRGVYFGKITEKKDMYEQVLELGGGAYKRFHPQIVPGSASSTLMLADSAVQPLLDAARFYFPGGEDTFTMRPLSHVVAVDLASHVGRDLLLASLKRLSMHAMEHSDLVRMALFHNGEPHTGAEETLMVIQEAQRTWKDKKRPKKTAGKVYKLAANATALLESGEWEAKAASDPTIGPLLKQVRKYKTESFPAGIASPATQAAGVRAAMKIGAGGNAVAAAGRVFLVSNTSGFTVEDFELAEAAEMEDRVLHVRATLDGASFPNVDAETVTSEWLSDLALKASLVVSRQRLEGIHRQELPQQWRARLTGFHAGGKEDAFMQVTAAIDPLCKAAQRIAPLLMSLAEVFGARVHVMLNPQADTTSLPIKGYFRYVLSPTLTFDDKGAVIEAHRASFSGLPHSKLLSMQLHPPDAWFVEASACRYDMDNIQLDQLDADEHVLSATYRLDHILITGHCSEERREAPAGLQLKLALQSNASAVVSDTLVMSNLGYFQLKAQPGVFNIALEDGRSKDMYHIWDTLKKVAVEKLDVSVLTWEPEVLNFLAKRRPGHEFDTLRDEEGAPASGADGAPGGGMWSSLGSMFGYEAEGAVAAPPAAAAGSKEVAVGLETIHVFSLASGHLYERMLKIMMLSVLRNTRNPVKFWLLRNFLSPQFKEAIPKLAKKHGFDFELVTYKWPSWLHQQTEKQRIIWGYKILMLDVLFPLSVPKVIYIDSDQVVRADVRELWDMDLKGRPYAYTPFCDNNKEMEGFRFWKQGFWSQHLGPLKYHISALYVVDLKRFRALGAGDSLRVVYSQLSRDPNSLANLDQDLPNYAQHQVPIFSLPQDWLWCETWCSNSTLKTAKTIDLCNNPMTKEPKLDQARRIVKEWEELDSVANAPEAKSESCSSGDAKEGQAA